MLRLRVQPLLLVPLAWALHCLAPGSARGNGAFPDAQSILAPAERDGEISLATNFGLVSTTDGGATWIWACELPDSNNGFLYQVGAAPARRLYALSPPLGSNDSRLVFSDDRACGWQAAGGRLGGTVVLDAFPDPTAAARVLAIASTGGTAGAVAHALYESRDGGATFTETLYSAPAGDLLTGVEIARSDPRTIYLTVSSGAQFLPRLLRSTDGGAHFATIDLQPSLGGTSVRLIAVDPDRPERVFLRASGAEQDQLAVAVVDAMGGVSVRVVLTATAGRLAAFARLPSKTILTAGALGADLAPALFRSTDGGDTFQPVPGAPHLRALAGRGTQVFGAADFQQDNYALGVSTDDGLTWRALMRFDQVAAIKGCISAACQLSCQTQVDNNLWPLAMCGARDTTTAAGPDGGAAPAPPPGSTGGGGCQIGGRARRGVALGALLLLAALALRRTRSLSQNRHANVAARAWAARHNRDWTSLESESCSTSTPCDPASWSNPKG